MIGTQSRYSKSVLLLSEAELREINSVNSSGFVWDLVPKKHKEKWQLWILIKKTVPQPEGLGSERILWKQFTKRVHKSSFFPSLGHWIFINLH